VLRNPRYAGYSTYTPKIAQLDGPRRRSYKAFILRDDLGEPIRGQWGRVVDPETWWQAHAILDDQTRVTNTNGSTKRKHLGSGLYRCGAVVEIDGSICGKKVTGAPRGYRCAGHVMRTGPAIDEYVMGLVADRLREPDARRTQPVPEESVQTQGITAAISDQRARILRAERDYDAGEIEARDLSRVRDDAKAKIAELETQRLMLGRSGGLAPVLNSKDPAKAFMEGSLDLRREVIDALATVTLYPTHAGAQGVRHGLGRGRVAREAAAKQQPAEDDHPARTDEQHPDRPTEVDGDLSVSALPDSLVPLTNEEDQG